MKYPPCVKNQTFDELTESFSEIEETEYKAHVDLRARLFTGTFAGTLRAGYKYQDKDKSKRITFYDVEPADETAFLARSMSAGNTYNATRKHFYAGDYTVGDFVSKQYLSRLDFGDPLCSAVRAIRWRRPRTTPERRPSTPPTCVTTSSSAAV